MLRVANGLNTVLNRLMKLMLEVQETGVQRKQQTFTSIGLVAFDDSVGLSVSMNRNIAEIENMVSELGGTEKLFLEQFMFEGHRYIEVRIIVTNFHSVNKSELARKYTELAKKHRELK
jgi:hypothetical protein